MSWAWARNPIPFSIQFGLPPSHSYRISSCPRHSIPSDLHTLSKVIEGIPNYMKWKVVAKERASFSEQTRYLYGWIGYGYGMGWAWARSG